MKSEIFVQNKIIACAISSTKEYEAFSTAGILLTGCWYLYVMYKY